MEELRVEDPHSFFNYLRMEPAMFDELVPRVGPRIEKHDKDGATSRLEANHHSEVPGIK